MRSNSSNPKHRSPLYVLAMVNVAIWAIAIIAMVFLIQDAPTAKKLFPILAGGIAIGISQISLISRV